MCACSVFQLLPEHIVKLIVDQVACHGRMRFDGLYLASDESKALQMPLLWVCRNFRDFVYQRFCREYALNLLSDPTDNYIRHPSWPYWLLDFDHYLTNRLTKELFIITDIRDVCSGKSLRHLSSAPYDGCAFPLVHTLSLYTFVGKESYEEGCPPDSEANIMAFVQRVKEVVPAVRVVNQDAGCSDTMPFEEYGSYAKLLISKLYQIVEVAEISSRNRLPGITLELEPIGRLTSVDWDFDGSDSRILALARQSSQSLQSLRLVSAFEKDIGELFWDLDNHRYVSYPCLHSLTLKFDNVSPVSQKSTFDGAIPFPRLSHLYILSQYPFGDDVVFRGNEATLECLNLPLFSEVVALLRKHRVFMRNSHPKLRDVNIGSYLGDKPNSFDSASDFMKFILSVASDAPVLEFYGLESFSEPPLPALSLLGNHTSIQSLTMSDVRLTLWDSLALIKLLPLLSFLCSEAPKLGELPQGFTEASLPKYVRSTYYPMAKRFRCWRFSPDYMGYHYEGAMCMLLLALACPNFDYVALDSEFRFSFMLKVKEELAMPWFAPHSPRLSRLLYEASRG